MRYGSARIRMSSSCTTTSDPIPDLASPQERRLSRGSPPRAPAWSPSCAVTTEDRLTLFLLTILSSLLVPAMTQLSMLHVWDQGAFQRVSRAFSP
jgi:hypothetical protein